MADTVPMTAAGKKKLDALLGEMEGRRPAILEKIGEARAKGDLSENAEYHAAREALGVLEARIADLRDKLARAQVVDPRRAPKDRVAFGAKVTVLNLDVDREETYELVGAGEDDVEANRILTTSPVAQGLMLKKVGDDAEVAVPSGTVRYRIVRIAYPR